MSTLRDLTAQILVDGEDLRIDDADVARIQAALPAGGVLEADDIKALIDIRTKARVVCPAFDQLFFPAFKNWLLGDGAVDLTEQFQLLRLLYGGGGVDNAEVDFIKELQAQVGTATPEFEALCQLALQK